MFLKRVNAFILYYGNINPWELDDYEWASAYNSIEYFLNKKINKGEM